MPLQSILPTNGTVSLGIEIGIDLPPILGPTIGTITPIPTNGSTYKIPVPFCLLIGDPR